MDTVNHNAARTDAIIREYNHLAPEYDRRWSFYIAETIQETLKRLDIKPDSKLLDIGCGTGSLLQAISLRYPSVCLVGIDLSREMLKAAHKKHIKKSHLITGQSQELPFRSNSFDTVVSCNVFHYLHKPQKCIREIIRILKPGGKIIITDWCDDYIACRICDLFLRLLNRAHFKTYGKRTCEQILRNTGCIQVHVDRYKINWLWGLMTAKAQKPSQNTHG
ncbi:MAG: class I SAM-dependent methyltransferase [wastewater metagenome]|nr:class I SAM-dependent methyltransferase [Candidatus Loosdrechtia aerotolerans]